MRRIGFVVNPIAGMGGRVGLKGTDGKVEEARERGAAPRAPDRAVEALDALSETDDVELITYGGRMGAVEAREAGFEPTVVDTPASEETTSEDTRAAVRDFLATGVDLVLFVGGDGTAVDVAETLETADDDDTPMLGIPAGVKVYSSVFGVTPRAAGRLAAQFDRTERREVNDIDEEEFRGGEVHTELRALARVPVGEDLQSSKQTGGGTVEGLAEGVASEAQSDEGVTYVLGPGSTLAAIKRRLGFDGTALGVDVWRDGVLVRDATESDILDGLGEENRIVVSPIGGQGFVFGRGNQQLSPDVIRRSTIEVVASRRKLEETGVLRVDTGNPDLDEELRGWLRVRVGTYERRLVKVV